MRSDLERLMSDRKLDGFVLLGRPHNSPALCYFTRGAEIGDCFYFGVRGGKAHLIHNPMERDEAAVARVETSTFAENHYRELVEKSSSTAQAFGRMAGARLKAMGCGPRVALYGVAEVGLSLEVAHTLEAEYSFELVTDDTLSLVDEIRYTKDEEEIGIIRDLGGITCGVMGQIRDYLRALSPKNGHYLRPDGRTAVLGDLRMIVKTGFMAHGLVEPHGSILAQGRDAGVPHNRGNAEEEIRPGEPIVCDIFPRQGTGGGYHFDMTRTFCKGQARPEVRELHQTVREAHERALQGLHVGSFGREHQEKVCDFFESKGHDTVRKNDRITEGYVHSLGHGLGVELHERPRLGGPIGSTDSLLPGTVFTVEPGLYYPSRGMGVRLEDVVVARENGTFENLTDFPYEMEV